MSELSPYAKLTGALEADGCYLVAAEDGQVRIDAHSGDETALERWRVPEVLGYIDRHRVDLRRWLQTPLDDLCESDCRCLYGTASARQHTGGQS